MTSSLLQRTTVIAAGAVLSLGLVGCGGSDGVSIPDGKGGSVSIDQDDEEFTLETEEGTVTSSTKLPDDFPTDDVPLIDGDVVSAVSVDQSGAGGFSAVISSSKSTKEAFDEAVKLLTDAGFESSAEFSASGGTIAGLEGAKYTVLIQAVPGSDPTTISYTIAPAGS